MFFCSSSVPQIIDFSSIMISILRSMGPTVGIAFGGFLALVLIRKGFNFLSGINGKTSDMDWVDNIGSVSAPPCVASYDRRIKNSETFYRSWLRNSVVRGTYSPDRERFFLSRIASLKRNRDAVVFRAMTFRSSQENYYRHKRMRKARYRRRRTF